MDASDLNGGKAETARVDFNLESMFTPEIPIKLSTDEDKCEDKNLNGDFKSTLSKKNTSPVSKRKSRKLKANSHSSDDASKFLPTAMKLNKRKASEDVDLSSSESEDFSGFATGEIQHLESGCTLLKKLIAEAESGVFPLSKRRKIASFKSVKRTYNDIGANNENSTDSDDEKIVSELASNNNYTEESSLKLEKSTNNSVVHSCKLRKNRSSRGASPGSAVRQKVTVDICNPAYRVPFEYGWKRELVYRAGSSENQTRRMADIYYYTPEGKKVRSYREVIEFLTTSELTIDNFTFFKEPLGVNDPCKEIIRDAKKPRDSLGGKILTKLHKKSNEIVSAKKSTPRKVDKYALAPLSARTVSKAVKSSSTLKIKLPTKKGTIKKESKSPSLTPLDNEILSTTEWNCPATGKNVQERSPSIKSKKLNKKKQTLTETDQRHFMVSICAGYHALSRIFQYLKVQELLRAARVCHMWRDLAAHPSLWKTVRMKNSQVTDWDGLADTLKCRGTQHLDLRKMLIAGEADNVWKKFVAIIPKVTSLIKLELCRCPAMVVQEVMKNCPQLEVLSAMSIKCDSFNLESVSNLRECKELRLKAVSGMSLQGDLMPLSKLSKITHLSLTSIKDLGKKKVDILHVLHNIQTLELGECSDFPEKFGATVLIKLKNLERLRLEKGQGSCCTFDMLEGISKLENLSQLELVNFDVKSGFDKYLANCKNIKRLLIIPTYVSQSATSNNMILAGVTELSNNLTHFVWGVTQELLRVTELFVDQCNQMSKQITGDSIPVLKPVPCLKLIEDILGDKMSQKDPKQQTNLHNPQVEILPLPHLQKLLLTALPKTRVKILKIPFHATWRQSISDSTSQ